MAWMASLGSRCIASVRKDPWSREHITALSYAALTVCLTKFLAAGRMMSLVTGLAVGLVTVLSRTVSVSRSHGQFANTSLLFALLSESLATVEVFLGIGLGAGTGAVLASRGYPDVGATLHEVRSDGGIIAILMTVAVGKLMFAGRGDFRAVSKLTLLDMSVATGCLAVLTARSSLGLRMNIGVIMGISVEACRACCLAA